MIHTAGLFVQSALAGEFLSGTDGVVKFHELTAWIILGVCTIQIALAALAQRTGAAFALTAHRDVADFSCRGTPNRNRL
jgi:hypothetical protein